MSIRKWAYDKVSTAPGLGVPAGRVFSPGAVGLAIPGDAPDRPFIVIRFGVANPGLQPRLLVDQVPFAVWIHDDPGTMKIIDDAVDAVRNHLPSSAPDQSVGVRVLECLWLSTSQDFYDDGFHTNVVSVEFQLTWKPTP